MLTNAHNTVSQRDAERLRVQACELLERLQSDRQRSEERLAETGKRDAMKSVTGCTALEAAIASTQELIQRMDRLVDDLRAIPNGRGEALTVETEPLRLRHRAQRVPVAARPIACVT